MRFLSLLAVAALAACGSDEGGSSGRVNQGTSTSSSSSSSSSSSGGGGSSSGGGGGDASQACVDKINGYRKESGLAPYARWTDGEACAADQAKSDGASNKGHGSFGRCDELAQTECPNYPGPPESMIGRCLELMWAEGPGGGHHDAFIDRKYKKVACGFATAPNGKIWAVQNYQ